MFYTYILRSISHPDQRYIGSTTDLKSRLAKHNAGEVPHTSKFKPWKVEAYFKTGAGNCLTICRMPQDVMPMCRPGKRG